MAQGRFGSLVRLLHFAVPNDAPVTFTRRPHREGDDEALLELLRAAFGEWPHVEIQVDPLDHLRWKLDGPGGAKGLHRITEVDGRLASSTFCVVQWVKARDRMLLSLQGTDSCVHPDFQQRGLLERIVRWRREHPDDQASDVQFGVRSPHPAFHKVRERLSGPQTIANELQALSADLREANPPAQSSALVRRAERFDQRIDQFWKVAAAPYDLIIRKTSEYLNWRYADPRAGMFSLRLVEQDGDVLGYAVLRTMRGKGYIADMLTLPDKPDVARALIDDALAYFAESGVSRVDCWLPEVHPYRAILDDAGFAFRGTPTAVEIHIRNPDVNLSFLSDPQATVHICAGDTDLI
jgi:GNAT superfamily N-acetyltransferase